MRKVCEWPFPAIERNLLYFSVLPTAPVARVAAGIHGLQVVPILSLPTTVSWPPRPYNHTSGGCRNIEELWPFHTGGINAEEPGGGHQGEA